MSMVSVWEDKKFLEMSGGDGCTIMRMYLVLQTVHLKMVNMVNFMLYVSTIIQSKNLKKPNKNRTGNT